MMSSSTEISNMPMLMPAFSGIAKTWIRFAAQSGECRPRVRKGVDANSEPRHPVAARDADQAETPE